MIKAFQLLVTFCCFTSAVSQVINGYAEVTAVAGTVFSIGASNEGGDTFEDGDFIVIMQMQDNVIGDVTDAATFGGLGAVNSAGLYEIREIESHTEMAGAVTSITLTSAPSNTYNICANCSVQLITFSLLGSPDFTTTAAMSSLAWDGAIGGVLALNCEGVLTLEHDLDASFDGFRGAGVNGGGSTGCSGGANYRLVTQANFADKGEGIYKNTTATYVAGQGKILNGGGGGNSHNAGGGGGGNYSAGGQGGPGWPTCAPSAGGLGGIALQSVIAGNRIFMGGGGGAGEGNNNLSTAGGDGGGIIIIKANEIETGTCTDVSISVNGENIPTDSGNDGGGGAGAAGSIIMDVNTWNASAGCPLVVESIGGNGNRVNSGATHGAGAGGGQGVVIYSTAEPMTNITTTVAPGSGGCNNTSDPCNSTAPPGGGAPGDGITDNTSGPLPVEFYDPRVLCFSNKVQFYWSTKSEINSSHFVIERSTDYQEWEFITKIEAAGNSSVTQNYLFEDMKPLRQLSYYRLTQFDFDGTAELLHSFSVNDCNDGIEIYPNPTRGRIYLKSEEFDSKDILIYNALGQIVVANPIQIGELTVYDLSGSPAGNYYISVKGELRIFRRKIVLLP